jgi:hypothetical protein
MKSAPVLIDNAAVERASAQIFGLSLTVVLVCVLTLTAITY